MLKKIILFMFIFIFLFPLTFVSATNVTNTDYLQSDYSYNIDMTNTRYITQSSGYKIIIEDDADLLTSEEEEELKKQMMYLSEFGNVLFKTTNVGGLGNSTKYLENYYYSKFKNDNGVGFYIDMKARQICACADGDLDEIISSDDCDTIMDNVYRYATNENYLECAIEAYSQMNRLLSGEKIAQSMKYISNAFLSVMIAVLISYKLFMMKSNPKKASNSEVISKCETSLKNSEIIVTKTGTHREYSPISDSSSSGGSSGGGGGGFSGSSGSHGF